MVGLIKLARNTPTERNIMPIRFRVTGDGDISIEADSVNEGIDAALELQRRHLNGKVGEKSHEGEAQSSNETRQQAAKLHVSDLRPTKEICEAFLDRLNTNGRKVVDALLVSPGGLDTDELARRIELSTTALPPVIRHVRASAGLEGLNSERAVRRTVITGKNGGPKSCYKLDAGLVEELKNVVK
jgi:hypothetical protein